MLILRRNVKTIISRNLSLTSTHLQRKQPTGEGLSEEELKIELERVERERQEAKAKAEEIRKKYDGAMGFTASDYKGVTRAQKKALEKEAAKAYKHQPGFKSFFMTCIQNKFNDFFSLN